MSARTSPRGSSWSVSAAILGLWLVVLTAVGVGDTGGQRSHGSVSVLATWTGREGTAFRQLLRSFTRDTGIRVDYQGTTALREVLSSEVKAGTAPDIAVLPTPGELATYADALQPLQKVLPGKTLAAYDGPLWKPAPRGDKAIYGIAVKTDLKSIVWYDRDRHDPSELPLLAARDGQWCAGMGGDATSGWPGTDWVEDILLQQRGKAVYEAWATGRLDWTDPRVKQAWRTWGSLFGKGTARTALLTDFRAAGRKLFAARPRCALEHQGSFIRGDYPMNHRTHADFDFSSGLIPDADRRTTAREVSADFAVMFRKTSQSQQLLAYLTHADHQTAWVRKTPRDGTPPFFANSKVPLRVWKDGVARRIARTLRDSGSLCLDASDAMPTRMRLAFQRAALAYLSDVGKGPDALLTSLEKVRTDLHREHGQPWLPTVCG
ncbi:ABC transporter substrate-binding protein [Streptomyces sp. NPDC019937]|uniref:ABC transporter substrate-binding protein n=1 Tax=Streptomyces sp. NPDC019937 TaxID=3154787 RepID=UPI0033FE960E